MAFVTAGQGYSVTPDAVLVVTMSMVCLVVD